VAERLPSVWVPPVIPGRADISVRKEIDPQNGDIILHGYSDYLNELDNYFESQKRQCEAQRPKVVRNWHAHETHDEYQMFRTATLLCWLGANSALVMAVVNTPSISRFKPTAEGGEGLIYVGVVLWAYASVAGFQYCCTVLYALSKLWGWLSSRMRAVLRSRRLRKEKEGV